MFKRSFIIMLMAIMTMLCSCGVQNVEKMPEIVFMCFTDHMDGAGHSIAFIDSVGNQYYTDSKVISEINAIDVYNEFVNGGLEDILVLKGTCEQSELAENYALMKKVAENENYELVSDTGYSMGVETARTSWIGFYYEDGEVPAVLTLRKSGYDGGATHISNDENANKIVGWFTDVLKQNF